MSCVIPNRKRWTTSASPSAPETDTATTHLWTPVQAPPITSTSRNTGKAEDGGVRMSETAIDQMTLAEAKLVTVDVGSRLNNTPLLSCLSTEQNTRGFGAK